MRQYLMTERAHFMCPNMHFGMIAEIEKKYEKVKVEAVLERMAEAHPFLKVLIDYEDGTDKLYYRVTEHSQINLRIQEKTSELWEDYKEISKSDWNVFENGLLKVYVYPKKQGMTVLFIASHLLADGRGLLDLVQEFANDYVEDIRPVYVEEQLLESIHDLPSGSGLSWISKILIRQINKQWKKESQFVTYDIYRKFAEIYSKEHPVKYKSYEMDSKEVVCMKELCKANNLTMNDLLMAHMFLKTGTDKIIIAADIRNVFAKYKKGAMGNYATAFGILYKGKRSNLIKTAEDVHGLVQKCMKNNRTLMMILACYFEMDPTLLDAAAISALGGFKSKAGSFAGEKILGLDSPRTYSITNLGKCENKNMSSLIFIPPASPAVKLTLGVVTLNGIMRACSSENVV